MVTPYEGKHCADCGTGFAPQHRRCPICGSTRIVADRGQPSRVVPAQHAEQGPVELLRAVPLGWARELAEALERAGVPHRLEPARASAGDPDTLGGAPEYAIWVAARDRERAARIDAEVFRRHVPDATAGARDIEARRGIDGRGLAVRVVTLLILSAILMLLTRLLGGR